MTNILNQPFDLVTYKNIITGLVDSELYPTAKDIRYTSDIISKVENIGHFFGDKHHNILVIRHNATHKARVKLATDTFKMMSINNIDKALIAYTDKSKNWRLSLVSINITIDERDKTQKVYSNPKRYSFLLGPNAKVKTPENLLIKKGKVANYEELQQRFSIEVVNKDFYTNIANHFNKLVGNDKTKQKAQLQLPFKAATTVNTQEFAVRLIGRIIFCWFLKQKSGTKGTLIPDNLLSSSIVDQYDDYYHEALEPLFFEVLNREKDTREPEYKTDIFDMVPYLNGGLFAPQEDDFYDPANKLAQSQNRNLLHIENDWFVSFFELLEMYNFTIDENTLIDQELSIDPEMLGRIFENLLASINPETGESVRKSTGSFYTPRQIVEYMVDESLVEYLKNATGIDQNKIAALVSYDEADDLRYPCTEKDKAKIIEALDNARILDPACGSGAFPIGILQKILMILQRIDPQAQLWFDRKIKDIRDEMTKAMVKEKFADENLDYVRKLGIIKDSIFGVDIQPVAVEVAKLRCFLTLIVEEEVNEKKPNRGIEPLPNLDFKFVCANTLIPLPDDEGVLGFDDDFHSGMASAVDRYFQPRSVQEKFNALNTLHKLIDKKVKEKTTTLLSYGNKYKDVALQKAYTKKNQDVIRELTRNIELWESYKNIFEHKPVGFFDIRYFFPNVKNGFDIVIGNPPYGAKLSDTNIAFFKKTYNLKTSETAILFIEKGMEILKDKASLCYIIPKAFTFASNYKSARDYVEKGLNIIVDCGKAFEEVKLEACIFQYQKGVSLSSYNSIKYTDSASFEKLSIIDKSLKDTFGFFLNGITEKEIIVGKKIFQIGKFLNNIATNSRGSLLQGSLIEIGTVKVIGGKEIDRYGIRGYKGFANSNVLIGEKHKIQPNSLLVQNIVAHIMNPFEHIKIIACLPNQEDIAITDTINQITITNAQYSHKFIWALLGSELLNWYAYLFIFGRAIRTMHFDNVVTDRIPIPDITSQNQGIVSQLESFVDRILATKQADPATDTSALEQEIDGLVYELYGLTEDEVAIVEGRV